MTGIWVAVLATAAGCYLLKLTGLTVPRSVLDNPRVRRFAELVPVALLAALTAVQAFGVLWNSPGRNVVTIASGCLAGWLPRPSSR